MYVRSTRGRFQPERIDDVEALSSSIAEAIKTLPGFLGYQGGVDRNTSTIVAISNWEDRGSAEFPRDKLGDVLDRNGLTPSDIDLFVSHQANRRIILSATEKLGMPPDKVIINIERFGNTTAATIPLALNDAVCAGKLKKGQLVLLASVGAGFTVGAVLLRWGF